MGEPTDIQIILICASRFDAIGRSQRLDPENCLEPAD
jgi:hypothetical protein